MQTDSAFAEKQNALILQSSRLSRLKKHVEQKTITQEEEQVELARLFLALETLAKAVGITNLLEFIGLQEGSL